MVRRSFTSAGPSPADRTRPARRAAAEICDFRLAHAANQEITVVIDIAPHALLARHPLDVAFCHRAETALLPGVDGAHEIAGETFHQLVRHHVGEAFFLKRRHKRIQSWLQSGHRHRADHAAEHQPFRRLILFEIAWPGQASTTYQALIDQKRVRPIDRDGRFRSRMSRERLGECCHAGIKCTPRAEQRFIRFENERKFGEIEAPDVDKRPRALFTCDRYCMGESVPHFPQANGGKGRRQCQFRCERGSRASWYFQRHGSRSTFLI
jgi:hypothetical protein